MKSISKIMLMPTNAQLHNKKKVNHTKYNGLLHRLFTSAYLCRNNFLNNLSFFLGYYSSVGWKIHARDAVNNERSRTILQYGPV